MKPLLRISIDDLQSLGVLDWGYTEELIPASWAKYESWLNQGLHGSLNYLADHRKNLRKDLRLIYPDCQSALVFLFSYQSTKKYMLEKDEHRLAAYALGFEGEDYHLALQRRLEGIFSRLQPELPALEYKLSLDIQPVLERDLAYRAGLGWFGKNSMLINQKEGSYFIIGSLFLNQKLPLNLPVLDVDHCGQCNACAEACPTQAIDPVSRTLMANNCISTFTIETFKEVAPPEGIENSRGEVFGCDICQDVCPWNKKPLLRTIAKLEFGTAFAFIKEIFLELPFDQLKEFLEKETNRSFHRLMKGTALDRPGRKGWLKNFVTTHKKN